ncbi:MAG: glycoside hydrolase family 2 protein [Hormoscilla sp.]
MNKKLAKLLGLCLLAAIAFGWIGHIGHTSGQSSTPTCPSEAIASYPPLTTMPPNSKRDQSYLNGVWQFIPAVATAQQEPPTEGWGKIRVPGDWRNEGAKRVPGLINRGTGDAWKEFNGKQLAKAWYQRTVTIPADWQGRRIILSLERISAHASLYVNNLQCGQVKWPYGAVDITKVVQPGRQATLSLLVTAAEDPSKPIILADNNTYITEAKLKSRGLIGEVRLLSLPNQAYISDLFVQPSTRKKLLKLDVELTDVTKAGTVDLIATMFDEKGEVEQKFTTTSRIEPLPTQTLQVAWDWANPRLWDVGKPNLYTLRLQVKGNGIDDEYDQSFGFREFWIEGRKFYLNGSEIRLRPVYHGDMWQAWVVDIPSVMDNMIDGYFWAGFNIAELWPWNYIERDRWHFRELFAERADLKGFPIMAPALDAGRSGYAYKWKKAEGKRLWEPKMVRDLRRYRNHPSILMWANSPNFFAPKSDDQNPRRIGQKQVEGTFGSWWDRIWKNRYPIGSDIVATIKKYDPTRPVLVHNGGAVGDVYALNSYLNLIPLQEREEWLSHWIKQGDMPYMVVEFGTPLHGAMMRGRYGLLQGSAFEPLMTEYSAIYFGKEAYQLETPAYRNKITELFIQDQKYKSWHGNPELDLAPAFQKLQYLFSTNTWRSWRTFGMTGGMIPWANGHGWEIASTGREMIDLDLCKGEALSQRKNTAQRGVYLPQIQKNFCHYFQPPGYIIHPGGQAIIQNNGPTLAWIAGGSESFVAKDHSFGSGEKLAKQAVLINDTRKKQKFSFDWQVKVDGQPVATGKKRGTISSATTQFFPLEVVLPEVTGKVDAEVILKATIGDRQHQDRFPFRVFPHESIPPNTPYGRGEPLGPAIAAFDPVGKTTRMLEELGYNVVPWDGSPTENLVVIGREALSSRQVDWWNRSSPEQKLLGNLETFVRKGGRVIIFPQDPEWIHGSLGLRVAPHLSRRVFPIQGNHPVVKGLDEQDLRNWRGETTLVEAYPNMIFTGMKLSPPRSLPWYGWHWGNRGTVSSAPIEKPHRSSWRPILESEFDLAYTPLMELDYGQGRLILTTLDFEDRVLQEPAAKQLLRQAIAYAETAPISAKAQQVILIGSDADARQLDGLGLIYQRASSLRADADLIIVGADAKISDEQLRGYLSAGGRLFFLPRRDTSGKILGVSAGKVNNFTGSLTVPDWIETRGLSASDVRSRADYDAWLIQSGGEIAADGLLSRVQLGDGVAIFCQLDPDSLNADTLTYFRYTRWRHTRAISQILANLGASFQADRQIFQQLQQAPKRTHLSVPIENDFYHPDYRTDFELGDDPYRYSLW